MFINHVLQERNNFIRIHRRVGMSPAAYDLFHSLDSEEEFRDPDQEVVWIYIHPIIDTVDDFSQLHFKRLFLIDSEVAPLLDR